MADNVARCRRRFSRRRAGADHRWRPEIGNRPRRRRLLSAIGAGATRPDAHRLASARGTAAVFGRTRVGRISNHVSVQRRSLARKPPSKNSPSTSRPAAAWRSFWAINRGPIFSISLYAEGNGLFPAPLEAPVPLLVEQSQKTPDLVITDHPIFRVFSGENNPFIKMVNIEKYFAVKKGWKPAEGSTTSRHRPHPQRRAAGDRKEIGRRTRRGVSHHRRAAMEQLGPR